MRLATKHSPDKAAAALVKKAVSRQADDNVSAIVVAIAPGKQKTAVPWKLFGGVAALLLLLVVAYFTYATLAGGGTAAVSTAPAPTAAAVVVELETAVPPTPVPTNPLPTRKRPPLPFAKIKGISISEMVPKSPPVPCLWLWARSLKTRMGSANLGWRMAPRFFWMKERPLSCWRWLV
ncbi:MAG: hypothetical protein M5U34_16840 [Chloroflexi bacterium]|nr:hypothetical protein [Chloroflexota bacterium]